MNERINGVLGHLCAHIGQIGLGETPEDVEMNETTQPSKHIIRNEKSGTLPLGHRVSHNTDSLRVRGET